MKLVLNHKFNNCLFMNLKTFVHTILVLIACANFTIAQQLAFPTAEGYGKFSKGGRGGKVIEVTRLEDDTNPGSLRYAINQSGPRTVVFRVSGTITLNSALTIKNPYITIAGQTAPGDGICIKKYPLMVEATHCIIRYLRVRLGDESGGETDAMGGKDTGAKNIIIDHCSVSWSIDETLSPYLNDSLTVQWCLVSESLYNSNHVKGAHGYGGIWGGNKNTYHHNLMAHHSSRNPRFASACGLNDFRNNVIYNWGFNSTYGGENYLNGLAPVTGQFSNINMVANYYKAGPGTKSGVKYRIVNPSSRNGATDAGKWYVSNNYVDGSPNITADNWAGGVQASDGPLDAFKSSTPFNTMPINQQTAEEAYQSVLKNVGANLPKRDAVDKRILGEVKNGNATYEGKTYKSAQGFPASAPITGMLDSQADVGGWPLLLTGPVPSDTDHDGMPDDWEKANGLNPADISDGDKIGKDGYTNLENYLNSITEYPAFIPAPSNLKGELNSANSIKLVWQDNSSMEKGFTLERAVGVGTFQSYKTFPANTITFLDENLADLTLYKYRVSCFSDSLQSAFTDIVELTTISATSKPLVVSVPTPANGENLVNVTSALQWKAGLNTISHDVYFGTSNPPSFIRNQPSTKYTTALQRGVKYYWRVDEVNQNGKTAGPVWSFTTKPSLPPQKISHWKFDEESGSTIKDEGSYKNQGSFFNLSQNPRIVGYFGGALNFNGISGSVVVPHNGSIDFGKESFSISYWLKVGALSGASMYTIQKGSFAKDTTTNASGKWYGFEIKSNTLRFSIDDDIVKTSATVANVDTLLKSRWNHVVGIRDSSFGQLKLYVNGKLLNTAAATTGDISENEPLYFGNTLSDNASLAGAMDDVRFYNYALAETEIQKIYEETVTGITQLNSLPSDFNLMQNYPNPFNPSTKINYAIPADSKVKLQVFDMLGREIATLIDAQQSAGIYTVDFNASNLVAGVYLYRMTYGNKMIVKKMMLLK